MPVESVKLTFPLVGLGGLTESAVLALFGGAKLAHLVPGDCSSEHVFVDASGKGLYPSYFMTHLFVPATCRLDEYRLWDHVDVGIEIRSSGGMFLDETCVLARTGEIPADAAAWPGLHGPWMRSGSLFCSERADGERQPGAPTADCVRRLDKLVGPPDSVARYTKVQRQGCVSAALEWPLRCESPVTYELIPGRDGAAGSHVLFSQLATIMDCAERSVLVDLWPPCPLELLAHASLLERETYYLDTCRPGQALLIDVWGQTQGVAFDAHGDRRDFISAGELTLVFNVYESRRRRLVLTSRVRKLLTLPSGAKGLLRDGERFVARYAAT